MLRSLQSSDFHFGVFKRVIESMPGFPLDAVGKGRVAAFKVDSVEIGLMTACVPPAALEPGSTRIVIMVLGVELGVIMKRHAISLKNRTILSRMS